jgi:hypothetical protein
MVRSPADHCGSVKAHDPTEVYIAGSIPTLIKGLTARPTFDSDFVDEVPAAIRRQRAVLRRIRAEFGLVLGHVQSHYLPDHWRNRREWFGEFGGLRVFLADAYDIFVSKLSSKLEKHQSDLRVIALKLDKATAKQRLLTDGLAFLHDPNLGPQIEENWRFIFQEPLSPDQQENRTGRHKQPEPRTGEKASAKHRPGHSRKKTR